MLAISSGFPILRSAILLAMALRASSGIFRVMSVSISPGAMALQRMLRRPISLAIDLVKPIMPALVAA